MAFSARLLFDDTPPDDFSKLAVEVSITGEEPAEETDVALICADPRAQAEVEIAGKRVHLRAQAITFRSPDDGPLHDRRWYYLPEEYLAEVKMMFEVFSHELMHVQVLVDGEAETIDGETLSEFVEAL
jgi:hypothetical protein